MIFDIAVGVALQRPPLIDEFRHIRVEAGHEQEARLIACQMASGGTVMPVWDGIPEDVPHIPEEWIR
jgi:hypothetical protein